MPAAVYLRLKLVPGLRMLDQPYMTDLIEANSMGHKPQDIHIYSASWGPTDDGKTVDGPRNATMRAIVKGVNEVTLTLTSLSVDARSHRHDRTQLDRDNVNGCSKARSQHAEWNELT